MLATITTATAELNAGRELVGGHTAASLRRSLGSTHSSQLPTGLAYTNTRAVHVTLHPGPSQRSVLLRCCGDAGGM